MKFGVVNIKEVDEINLSIPEDSFHSKELLKQLPKAKEKNLYIGTSVWADPSFKGILYPPKTKPSDYLSIYAENFNCIELNSTFYGVPPKERILKWKDSVNKGFKFCPKVPKTVSHRNNIQDTKNNFDRFLDNIFLFEENLGCIFMQLPQYFSPKNIDNIIQFLELIPKNLEFAIEFRNANWFTKEKDLSIIETDLFNHFKNHKISFVITDTPGRRDVLHQIISSDSIFIRFVGNELHSTDFLRLDSWIKKFDEWFSKNIKNIYFTLHEPNKSSSLELLRYLQSSNISL